MDDKQPILEAIAVERSFVKDEQTVQVLRGVNLAVKSGETLAIVGASGAGKSTFLHILGTLDQPTSGSIRYFGREPPFRLDRELSLFRNQNIGFVFQFHHLLPEFNALENVMLPCLIAERNKSEAKQTAGEILREVGLADRLTHRPGELSGGEQQRVAIARALVLKPRVLLADEPTGNLDRENGRQIQDLLLKLNQTLNVTVILATHNLEMAGKMNRLLTMVDGQLKENPR